MSAFAFSNWVIPDRMATPCTKGWDAGIRTSPVLRIMDRASLITANGRQLCKERYLTFNLRLRCARDSVSGQSGGLKITICRIWTQRHMELTMLANKGRPSNSKRGVFSPRKRITPRYRFIRLSPSRSRPEAGSHETRARIARLRRLASPRMAISPDRRIFRKLQGQLMVDVIDELFRPKTYIVASIHESRQYR